MNTLQTLGASLLAASILLAGCNGRVADVDTSAAQLEPTASQTVAAKPSQAQPTDEEVMAIVNGKPIYMKQLHEALVAAFGQTLAQQLISNELVRQELGKASLSVTPADVAVENEFVLQQAPWPDLQQADREKILTNMLARKNISRKQWDLTMLRQAMLRKLAERNLNITEQDLLAAFGLRYGRRIVIRHIQLASAEKAQELLKQLRNGADFAELASKHSINATGRNGGLLAPMAANDKRLPPGFTKAAAALEEPGQISDIVLVETAYHILKLEKIIEPEPVNFQDVRDELSEALRAEKITELQHQILMKIVLRADIKYVDPVVKSMLGPTAIAP